ncbi:dihydrolipoamide acetyltransferase family protein [Actinomadura sp. HBU206391]|uniref:dihydrolipoamide acetyltransferase family protein n=1 Tax=Actinomadura sp. HBU206391 TaxID=2731692 RepID=UPI0016504E11|nr:dihydrolipoamide acetyltransferase family protein [Actinomadura sp. HBU206391]MBC6462236.1 2-oxo acid dehydrogenase subunit E2 [Actinomadura sp. HBU206391]
MTAQEFTLPDLGEGLTEAEVVRWLVATGDTVAVDQPIVEVETAKATVEVPSPFGGVVTALHAAEGAVVAVGAPLIVIDDDPGAAADQAALGPEARRYVEEERAGSGNVLVGYGTAESGRRRRKSRRSRTARGNGSTTATRPLVISPVVRRLAREHKVDLTTLTGSAVGGVITRADVQKAIAKAGPAPGEPPSTLSASASDHGTVAPPATISGPLPVRDRIALRGMRRSAAEAFTRSRREIPEATTWVDVDATALVQARREINDANPDDPVGLLALFARFVLAGLARHPELNSRVDLDAGEIVQFDGVNLGIATQTDSGLFVPVVHKAHRLSARELHHEIERLTAAARAGGLSVAELTGGTFTLNNYGVFGVDGSAAIINHPEAAILGIGRIIDRPWAVDGELAVRKIVQLSLAFDHRVCDGGPAAAFLRFVADCVENPRRALAEI